MAWGKSSQSASHDRRGLGAAIALGVAIMAVGGPALPENTYTVGTEIDEFWGFGQAEYSVREAIDLANGNLGPDIVEIPPGHYLLTRAGVLEDGCETGDLDILEAVTIKRQDGTTGEVIIDATGLEERVFHVIDAGGTVTFDGITINGADTGGGIFMANAATGDTLRLSSTIIRDNYGGSAGGLYLAGIDSSNRATIEIIDSMISDNEAQNGPAVYLKFVTGSISGSTISNHVNYSHISNTVGAGIFISGDVSLENCTIFGNVAAGGTYGYGIGFAVGESSTVKLHSVSISLAQGWYDPVIYNEGTLHMTNTIIQGSCLVEGLGNVVSNGGNLESRDTCNLGSGDQVNAQDLLLSWLGDWGGPTQTLLPLTGSPAINQGTLDYCLQEDQRGLPRNLVTTGRCDAGAVERQPAGIDPIFFDDFESGDTTAWSATVQ